MISEDGVDLRLNPARSGCASLRINSVVMFRKRCRQRLHYAGVTL